jgi:glutamate-1-semialdehyde 2,1-aminomutase
MSDADNSFTPLEAEVQTAYRERTPKSADLHVRASKSLIGGVSGTVRYFKPYPLYFAEGTGAHATDLDGNTYVDNFLCGACLLLGHRSPVIMEAISGTAQAGSLLLNPMLAIELAEALQQTIPSAERVRFLNSGTEAVTSALRFARAFTGREKIVKFLGTYHGQGDEMLAGLDPKGRRLGGGITAAAVSQTIMLPFGDMAALATALSGGEVAAVLVDPTMHHAGLWAGSPDTYGEIADLTHKAGALLIFDEVISGFRLAAGGGQEYFGVTPDLSIFGKALGAGEKIGAVVGRAEVMAVANPANRTGGPFAYQSGTGNDVRNSLAASLAAVTAYRGLGESGGYQQISALAVKLGEGLKAAFEARDIACHFNALGPMVRLFLTAGPATYEHCAALDARVINLFHLALTTEGVLTLPGSNDFFLSFAHTENDILEMIAAAGRVLDRFEFGQVTDRVGSAQ